MSNRAGHRIRFIPTEPLVFMLLIGMLLTGSVLYYRAVRFQRFVEPTLAMLQPRIAFADNIRRMLLAELDNRSIENMELLGTTIRVRRNLLGDSGTQPVILRKLGHVFEKMLRDPAMKSNVQMILIKSYAPVGESTHMNLMNRMSKQEQSYMVLEAMFRVTPELERNFPNYFSATSVSTLRQPGEPEWIEFDIIPSERIHIEVLQRLEKYAR